ncbi:TPA: hypothetical protein NGT07_000431 [Vibrio parahaemolyticus]|uniref:hypothetical protein n=1 Tax=Vibrio parahaemolyticus TaxID=670 RepID=UPI0022B2AD3C|nr:hypothetical protein [Vibrio parahaemolyticus]MCZ6385241.1 hypothetical protein [Vibrio parahaemolyticus]HCE4654635.1 hypothetical protein [Vibrio parahaemolyticus]HCM1424507.1 hypothetical protein [Vibrio parahaemolyticus]
MSEQEDSDFKVEQKVTNTVGAEIYRDVKRLIKFCLKGIIAIVVILIVYVNYNDYVKDKHYKAKQVEYDKQRAIEAQQRKQAELARQQEELARRIDLPIAWNGSDKWRQGMRSWGNAGFVFTSNQFILNIDSKQLTKEQRARIQGKELSCAMKLSVGDYEEYIAGEFIGSIFGLEGDYETTVYDWNKARVSDSMFLYVDLNIENADDKAPNFEAWDLKCGDLVSKVEYNKKGN